MVVSEKVARQAIAEGVAELTDDGNLEERIREYVWDPAYLRYERVGLSRSTDQI